MKIKIPPYPNFGITESAYNTVESDSVKTTNSEPLTSKLILLAQFKTGEKRVLRVRPVEHDKKLYVSAFPNPVHLFLSVAIEHFDLSENIKNTNFPKCGKKYGDDIYILDFEESGTHECYNNYMKYRCSSIVMLVSSIEAFLNHVIPNDFKYKTKRKGMDVEFNKIAIESPKISFREKMGKVIPQYLKSLDLDSDLKIENETIFGLYSNRRNIIHLKTNAEDDLTAYFDAMDKMLEFDLKDAFEKIISFMNKVKPDFVEVEKK